MHHIVLVGHWMTIGHLSCFMLRGDGSLGILRAGAVLHMAAHIQDAPQLGVVEFLRLLILQGYGMKSRSRGYRGTVVRNIAEHRMSEIE